MSLRTEHAHLGWIGRFIRSTCMFNIAILGITKLFFSSTHSGALHVLAIVLTIVVAVLLFLIAASTPDLARAAARRAVEPDVD
jgi:hypothetical protein